VLCRVFQQYHAVDRRLASERTMRGAVDHAEVELRRVPRVDTRYVKRAHPHACGQRAPDCGGEHRFSGEALVDCGLCPTGVAEAATSSVVDIAAAFQTERDGLHRVVRIIVPVDARRCCNVVPVAGVTTRADLANGAIVRDNAPGEIPGLSHERHHHVLVRTGRNAVDGVCRVAPQSRAARREITCPTTSKRASRAMHTQDTCTARLLWCG